MYVNSVVTARKFNFDFSTQIMSSSEYTLIPRKLCTFHPSWPMTVFETVYDFLYGCTLSLHPNSIPAPTPKHFDPYLHELA